VVDHVIPANDDAIRAVLLISSKIADAVIEGQQMRGVMMAEDGEDYDETDVPPAVDLGADDYEDSDDDDSDIIIIDDEDEE